MYLDARVAIIAKKVENMSFTIQEISLVSFFVFKEVWNIDKEPCLILSSGKKKVEMPESVQAVNF